MNLKRLMGGQMISDSTENTNALLKRVMSMLKRYVQELIDEHKKYGHNDSLADFKFSINDRGMIEVVNQFGIKLSRGYVDSENRSENNFLTYRYSIPESYIRPNSYIAFSFREARVINKDELNDDVRRYATDIYFAC